MCLKGYFDYGKSSKLGYEWETTFLTGLVPNLTHPTWKGISGNLTFKKAQQLMYNSDFSKVDINKQNKFIYILGKGYCLQSDDIGEELHIISEEKNLDVYLVHSSTTSQIVRDKSTYAWFEMKSSSLVTYELIDAKLTYEIVDNTIKDGETCVDYRNLDETYGDCNYRALKGMIIIQR